MSNKRKKNNRNTPAKSQNQGPTQRVTATHQRIEGYSGPLPHPQVLAGYDQTVPGAAERILVMAEKNAQHQIDIENKTLDAFRKQQRLGQFFGFGIGIAALSASITALVPGYEYAAMLLGGTTVTGLVAVFVTGRIIGNKQ